MNGFTDALEQRNLEELRKYPKADLHNHFVLGGNRRFIYQETRKKIEPLANPVMRPFQVLCKRLKLI